MDGRRTGGSSGLDDLVLIEVGLADGLAFKKHNLVRHFREERTNVVGGADGHGWVAGLVASTEDSACDFPTVCDQDLDTHPSLFFLRFPVGWALFEERGEPFLPFL